MDAGAGLCIARGAHGLVDVAAIESVAAVAWQQRRMDVEDASLETFQRLGAQLAHIARQHDQFGASA